MDLHVLISLFSVMYSWMLCTALAVPTGETPAASTSSSASSSTQGRHVRTKRCSCATFLDKECVYFCHLDIIWVNTPERVVSYGLGNAPRTRRAVSSSVPRCQCFSEKDNTCRDFCQLQTHHRFGTLPGAVIRSAEGDDKLAADKRMTNSVKERGSPLALRAAVKTSLLLEKWRVRQRHRARAWEGESAAS